MQVRCPKKWFGQVPVRCVTPLGSNAQTPSSYMAAQHVERPNTYIRYQRHENRKSFKTGEPANSGLSKMQLFLRQSTYTSGDIDINELEKVREALLPLFQKTGPKPSYAVDEHWCGGDTVTVRVTYRLRTWVGTVAWTLRRERTFGATCCANPRILNI
jgi:hypothetical protein